jgi:hypothetical protein
LLHGALLFVVLPEAPLAEKAVSLCAVLAGFSWR